jgi:hypothetical protein
MKRKMMKRKRKKKKGNKGKRKKRKKRKKQKQEKNQRRHHHHPQQQQHKNEIQYSTKIRTQTNEIKHPRHPFFLGISQRNTFCNDHIKKHKNVHSKERPKCPVGIFVLLITNPNA